MKSIYKVLAAGALVAPLFTSCIEEPLPTNAVVQEQLNANPGASDALVAGMPSRMNQITLSSEFHFDYGYSSLMHVRDVMLEDMAVDYAGGYDWYSSWSANDATSDRYITTQFIWNYFYEQILTANMVIGAIDHNTEFESLKANLAYGYGYRAMMYLDGARMYEFLPTELFPDNKNGNGNDVLGLTMVKVTEETTEDEYRNNPRLPHAEMLEFILSDLDSAEKLLDGNTATNPSKTMPSLAAIYGFKARAYLWDASYQEEVNEDAAAAKTAYENAAKYARLAINTSGAKPLTKEEWQDRSRGFNDESFSSWIMAGKYSSEDVIVTAGGIRTFPSFCCNEENFGYAAPAQGAVTMIGASLYNKIDDRDFRKLSWVAPESSPLSGKEAFINDDFKEILAPYCSLKFRPGNGNTENFIEGAAIAYPIMRVEEMYFIEAEATAHNDAAAGNALLKTFMQNYRYSAYNNNYNTTQNIVNEIVLQKRIELWGEGQSFFDVKRLNYSVIRFYNGTNFNTALNTFNTNGRPAWMNFVITRQETTNNSGVASYNSPSPEGLYTPIR
ncbi:MAG: RagB/SusD family nutrient uptake outer membrane protein [Bacteroidales bacterium]|nr:RagB/SusD family nutrient uptake outer membrane protein [Bacteroidales bacterium]